jgi:hypothetical protein
MKNKNLNVFVKYFNIVNDFLNILIKKPKKKNGSKK